MSALFQSGSDWSKDQLVKKISELVCLCECSLNELNVKTVDFTQYKLTKRNYTKEYGYTDKMHVSALTMGVIVHKAARLAI
jgi:hypothetical protein